MPESPPPELVSLVARLGVDVGQLPQLAACARRLARGLPLFPSVWVDALADLGKLTRYQALEIHAGRGEGLVVGDYVLCRPLPRPPLGQSFVAREAGRRLVQLTLIPQSATAAADFGEEQVLKALQRLAADAGSLELPGLAPLLAAGSAGPWFWLASRVPQGGPAHAFLCRNGRFPPEAVLEIARQMLAALAALEPRRLVHGQLHTRQVWISPRGEVVLPLPGVRGILRPHEDSGPEPLAPEVYDGLAPERATGERLPDAGSDLFACGCLWWELLTGRPALAGADALAKLRAARAARIPDVRRLAPDVPALLAEAIACCTRPDPLQRPKSAAALAAELGPPTPAGRRALVRALRGARRQWAHSAPLRVGCARRSRVSQAVAGGLLLVVGLLIGLGGGSSGSPPGGEPVGVAVRSASSDRPAPAARPAAGQSARRSHTEDQTAAEDVLLLPAGQAVRAEALRLRPGQVVCGESGRARVVVEGEAIEVRVEDIRFEQVDFVLQGEAGSEERVLVDLHADRASFAGCSFQHAGPGEAVAVAWHGATHHAGTLPTGQLRFTDTVFRGLAGVDCRSAAAVRIDLAGSLHLGPGAWVRLAARPPDGPCLVRLEHCTLREADALLEYRLEGSGPRGDLVVQAHHSVFSPRGGGAMVVFQSSQRPEGLLRLMRWQGEGSLVTPEGTFALWQAQAGSRQPLDDENFDVDGLVRGQVEFRAPSTAGPAASAIERWAAPLRSADPPGIDSARLGSAARGPR